MLHNGQKRLDYMMNICNKEQNDDSVNNLSNFIGYKSEQNEISFPENLATL